jgi:hypothetical protein
VHCRQTDAATGIYYQRRFAQRPPARNALFEGSAIAWRNRLAERMQGVSCNGRMQVLMRAVLSAGNERRIGVHRSCGRWRIKKKGIAYRVSVP